MDLAGNRSDGAWEGPAFLFFSQAARSPLGWPAETAPPDKSCYSRKGEARAPQKVREKVEPP
eukprot:858417-Alexandrium_andersonii.AAC.1